MENNNTKNHKWSEEETLLALDVYFRNRPATKLKKDSEELNNLSHFMRLIQLEIIGNVDTPTLRNTAGMKMKMGNFVGIDPKFPEHKGLSGASKQDKKFFDLYVNNQEKLSEIVHEIKNGLVNKRFKNNLVLDIDDGTYVGKEGREITRIHRTRERDPKIIKEKKEKVLKERGRLVCEVCGFDFEKTYGERGYGYIECHHKIGVSNMNEDDVTRLEDLALVCSNCHRMIHRKKDWLTISELKEILSW